MPPVLNVIIAALIVSSALGLAVWLMIRALKRSMDPARLLFRWILTLLMGGFLVFYLGSWGPSVGAAFIVPFVCVGLGVALSIMWAPSLAEMFAKPITSAFDGGLEEAPPEPLYSIAEARRKRGQYHEALWAIQDQLKLFPTDFTGQMLMAEIQAEDLKDMNSAEVTIQRFCQQPDAPPPQVAAALNRLADWRLKYRQDREGAIQALQSIIDAFPDSSLAYAATQRLSHLVSNEQLLEAGQPKLIHVPTHPATDVFDPSAVKAPPAAGEDAQALVNQLEQYPEDNEAREQLALAYARQYQRMDLAIAELEQLIAQTHAPVRSVVHWLNLMADLQVDLEHNEEAARQNLQRIIDLYPNHSSAEMARQRQSHLKFEMRKGDTTTSVKLGTYEQDLGLKLPPNYAQAGYKPPPV
jgi:TolA-binding protein